MTCLHDPNSRVNINALVEELELLTRELKELKPARLESFVIEVQDDLTKWKNGSLNIFTSNHNVGISIDIKLRPEE